MYVSVHVSVYVCVCVCVCVVMSVWKDALEICSLLLLLILFCMHCIVHINIST